MPAPLDALFCWLQLGDANDCRKFMQEGTRTDDGLMSALEAMRGWHNTAEGTRNPVRREYVEHFLDADDAKTRLAGISTNEEQSQTSRDRARRLMEEWTDKRQ